MTVKKTSSPIGGGAEPLKPLDAKDEIRRGEAVDKSFEVTLAEVTGQIEQAGADGHAESPTRAAFQQIAQNANLDSPEGAMTAVRQSARFLVSSRLKDSFKDSYEGRKISEDLSNYISLDPFMHRKILGILQRLK